MRGELKKKSKYEKEYAENSQKLIDPMQKSSANGQLSVTRVRDSARVMRVARSPLRAGVAPVSTAVKHKSRMTR